MYQQLRKNIHSVLYNPGLREVFLGVTLPKPSDLWKFVNLFWLEQDSQCK